MQIISVLDTTLEISYVYMYVNMHDVHSLLVVDLEEWAF